MTKIFPIKLSVWTALTIFGLIMHSINSDLLRPRIGLEHETVKFLLGVAPNFLAAGLIFPFGFLMVCEYYDRDRDIQYKIDSYFWKGLISSFAGLIIWEVLQQSSGNLIFDLNDIIATFMGALFAISVYLVIKFKHPKSRILK